MARKKSCAGFRPQKFVFRLCNARMYSMYSCARVGNSKLLVSCRIGRCGCTMTQRTLANRASIYKAEARWYFTLRFLKPQHGAALNYSHERENERGASDDSRYFADCSHRVYLVSMLYHERETYSCAVHSYVAYHTRWKTPGAANTSSVKKKRSAVVILLWNIIFDFTFFLCGAHRNITDCICKRYIPLRLKLITALSSLFAFGTSLCLTHSRWRYKKEQDLMPNVSR